MLSLVLTLGLLLFVAVLVMAGIAWLFQEEEDPWDP